MAAKRTASEGFVFTPTGTLDDEPVMAVKRGATTEFYDSKGFKIPKGSKTYAPGDPPPPPPVHPANQSEGSENAGGGSIGEDVAQGAQEAQETAAEEAAREPYELELSREEVEVCLAALRTQYMGENIMTGTLATYQSPHTVLFSRRENGVDRRRIVTLPESVIGTATDTD